MLNNQTIRLKKLLHFSKYRGCKECDILLGQFADHIASLTIFELELYENLLNENDNDILVWLTQRQTSSKYQLIIEKIIYVNQAFVK